MIFLKKTKVMIGIAFLSLFLQSNASAGEFNDSKLTLMCDFFSTDKDQCYKEVAFLKSKDTKNSIVSQCYSKYKSVKRFNDCLKYEHNPLIFLRYQNERSVSTKKLFDMKDEVVVICSKYKEKDQRFECIKKSYLLIEKGKSNKNWLENACLYKNKRLSGFIGCTNKIKKDALSDNNLIISIPSLTNALDLWDIKLNNRITMYFNQVYQECELKYSRINAFECMDGKLGKNIEAILSFNFSNSECFKYGKYEDFDKCLNRKK